MGIMDDILKEVVPSEIKHYGVKGMQWGVRRSNTTTQDSSPGLPVSGGGGQDEYLWENEYTPGQELTEEQMAEAYQRGWDTILTREGKFIVDKFNKSRAKKAPTAGFKKEALIKKQEPFKAAKPGSQKGSGIFNDNAKLGVRISKSKNGKREVTEVKHASVDGEVIKHYGVKGMKWGKTKAKNEDPLEDLAEQVGGAAEDIEDDLLDATLESKLQIDDKAALAKIYLNKDAYRKKPKSDAGFKAVQFINNLFGDKRKPIERNVDFVRKLQDATRPARKWLAKMGIKNKKG